mmetsp:Transcript_19537/g.69174  ORF Transcript_19537/g.69174 Transcript_19537/m.69174 type:complete len:335 (-) Transcript_19537:272-1276(-)
MGFTVGAASPSGRSSVSHAILGSPASLRFGLAAASWNRRSCTLAAPSDARALAARSADALLICGLKVQPSMPEAAEASSRRARDSTPLRNRRSPTAPARALLTGLDPLAPERLMAGVKVRAAASAASAAALAAAILASVFLASAKSLSYTAVRLALSAGDSDAAAAFVLGTNVQLSFSCASRSASSSASLALSLSASYSRRRAPRTFLVTFLPLLALVAGENVVSGSAAAATASSWRMRCCTPRVYRLENTLPPARVVLAASALLAMSLGLKDGVAASASARFSASLFCDATPASYRRSKRDLPVLGVSARFVTSCGLNVHATGISLRFSSSLA